MFSKCSELETGTNHFLVDARSSAKSRWANPSAGWRGSDARQAAGRRLCRAGGGAFILRWSLPRRAGWRLWVLNTILLLKIRLLSAFASPLAGACKKTPRVFSDGTCAPACEEVSAWATAGVLPRVRRLVLLRAWARAGYLSRVRRLVLLQARAG